MKNLIYLMAILFLTISCENISIGDTDVAFGELEYEYNIPLLETEFSNDVVKLGRVLFYDQVLSQNGNVSCASCHQQKLSFGDNKSLSVGFNQGLTSANTISLSNTKFSTNFFWNGRVRDIHTAVTNPIFNSQEMGLTETTLVNRIKALDYYDQMLVDAYGSDKVSKDRIAEALAQFVESIISKDSKFDRFQQDGISLSREEDHGAELFKEHCNNCHGIFSNVESDDFYTGASIIRADIGLDDLPTGYYQFIQNRVPSLRNVGLTFPYMHDGRFQTLTDVIQHYNKGVTTDDRSGRSIHPFLLDDTGDPKKLNLEDEDVEALEAFLHTLTDESILTDVKFSDPFIR